jgi:hypothetical protein
MKPESAAGVRFNSCVINIFYDVADISIKGDAMDIVIIREGDGYRLLHGHLRLANVLREAAAVNVHVHGEGEVQVVRVRSRYMVKRDGQQRPLQVQ